MSNLKHKLETRHRIRHIRHISLRRLSITEIPTLFFTLHSLVPTKVLIYRSESHAHSRNPAWKKIARRELCEKVICSDSRFILRVWLLDVTRDSRKEKLLLEWVIDLNELVGIENHRIGILTSPNLVLFDLRNASKNNLLFTDKALVEGMKVITYEQGWFSQGLGALRNASKGRG